ncbi:MAG TPA: choice-of-anchor R domain-containing protein [Verrucomicrobiae bacterium]|nr:choice-of-anchor R domain-containing protein [Verrucomicrobiae bacterium]
MKKLIIIFLVALLASRLVQAQGTTYLSNLGQAPVGSNPVGNDSWLAAGFFTGNNVGGYMLNSVQLEMTDASGSPSGFTIMIYDRGDNPNVIVPGSSLGVLSGSADPSTGGIYTYTTSGLTLSPSTYYYVVLTAGTAVANGAYDWSVMNTASYNPDDSWIGSVTLVSHDGSSWGTLPTYPQYDFSQFAITATPVPEPSSSWLILFGGGILFYVRRSFQCLIPMML